MSRATDAPIAEPVVEQASHWLMLHWQGSLDDQQQAAFDAWLADDAEHRRAWSRLGRLQQELTKVPAATSLNVLRQQPELRRRHTLKLLSTLLLIGGGGAIAHRTLPWREAMADLRSGVGETLQRTLADGSQLRLNTDTAVDIRFNDRERRIRLLRGEVLLDSGHDPAFVHAPLIVETEAGEVQALGTRFSVQTQAGGSSVQLYDGALEIRPREGSAVQLKAGQSLWFNARRNGPPGKADLNAIAWSEGRLVAEQMSLGRFIAELSRYRPGVLRCDPAVANYPLSGVFPLADTDRILQALEQTLPVRVQRITRYWVSVLPRD